MDTRELETLIRRIIQEELSTSPAEFGNMNRQVDKSGVIGIEGDSVQCEPFETGNRWDEVYLKDVISLSESPRLGCGYMEIVKDKPFSWTLEYDEVDVILDGTLEIITETGKVRGSKGDTIFIPKDSKIQFSCPEGEKVRFVYITYPADWNER